MIKSCLDKAVKCGFPSSMTEGLQDYVQQLCKKEEQRIGHTWCPSCPRKCLCSQEGGGCHKLKGSCQNSILTKKNSGALSKEAEIIDVCKSLNGNTMSFFFFFKENSMK